MNIKITERIERAKMHLLKVLESEWRAARKADQFSNLTHQLKELHEAAGKDWSEWYNRVKALRVAEAERKDKGEVWFTVFRPGYPGSDELKEITVTPRLERTRYYRLSWLCDRQWAQPRAELRQSDETLEKALTRSHEWGLKYYCKPEASAAFRRKNLPAWANGQTESQRAKSREPIA